VVSSVRTYWWCSGWLSSLLQTRDILLAATDGGKKLVNTQGFRTQDEKYRSARSMLVVVGGLPATGKSTIAGTLAVAKCGKPHSRGGSGPDLGPIRASRVKFPAHQQLGNILRS